MKLADKERRARIENLAVSIREKLAAAARNTDHLSSVIDYNDNVTNIPIQEINQHYLPQIAPIDRCLGMTYPSPFTMVFWLSPQLFITRSSPSMLLFEQLKL